MKPVDRLRARLSDLDAEDAAGRDGQKTVELDQQAVGRLSRMDALQNQAMAQAQARRRTVERKKIEAALVRWNEGEFGFCIECGDEIEARRLDSDPAIALCGPCMRGE